MTQIFGKILDTTMHRPTPKTYLTVDGRPTRTTLSQALGFNVPSRFAEYICQLHDFAGGDPESCLDAFDVSLGLFPRGQDARYDGTPPELFPIGKTGCDGDHYGFLLHAPELELNDLPFAHYCPMDSEGVILVGSTTEMGIASVMAWRLSYDFVGAVEKERIAKIASACKIRPQEEQNPAVSVPIGWRFVPSSDGIGTLAPAKLFASEPLLEFDRYKSPAPFEDAAERAIRGGHWGTALHYLREGLWFFGVTKPFSLARRMIDVYSMMNREVLANELTHTMSLWIEAGET